MEKVKFITNSETKKDYYKTILKNEIFEVIFVTENYDNCIDESDKEDYVFIDLQEEDQIKSILDQTDKIGGIKVALVSNVNNPDKMESLLQDSKFELVIPKKHVLESGEEVTSTQDLVFIIKLLKSDHFNIEDDELFPDPKTIEIQNIDEKNPTIETIKNEAIAAGYKTSITDKMSVILDELITNAVFHAPVNKSGLKKYSHVKRNISFKLAENETVTVKYSVSKEHSVFKVIDNFGNLTWDHFNNYIKNAIHFMRGGDTDHLKGQVGGGIGLGILLLMSHYLLLRVEPGIKTEFTVVLRNTKRRKDQISTPKLMYFYDFGK